MKTSTAPTIRRRVAALLPAAVMLATAAVHSRWSASGLDKATARSPFANASACASCHGAIAREFADSPHRRTLTRMSETELAQRLAGQSLQDPTRDTKIEFRAGPNTFSAQCQQFADGKPVEFQWCFGSGQHAQTPVAVLQGPDQATWLIQSRLSWFAKTDGMDLTPGEMPTPSAQSIEWLGRVSDEGQVRRCFGCHTTTWTERNGAIDFSSIVPGIQCEKCHGPRASHVERPQKATNGAIPGLKHQSALESIRWCGVCHRQDELVGPSELDPNNVQLTRFAPIGLVQSECFRLSPPARQPTCLTCHDPHKAASRDVNWYSDQCRKCHSRAADSGNVACKVEPATRDCISCHMPKVEVGLAAFTDHWIRVRSDTRAGE